MDSEEHSSSSGKRSRTSDVWSVFGDRYKDFDDGGKWKSKCGRCGKALAADSGSGTSHLRRHLEKCDDLGSHESRYPVVDHSGYRAVVSKSIVRHNYPFNVVEHQGNREVHQFLNPTVRTVSRNTAKSDVLTLYHVEKEVLKRDLELVPGRICLTSDMWSSPISDGYMCVTAHYVDPHWMLQQKILVFRCIPTPHNGPILGDWLIRFLTEWGIDKKFFSITLDNASYQDGMVRSLKEHLEFTGSLVADGEYLHVRCSAHILNLIVQSGLKAISGVVSKVRESVKYVRGSQDRTLRFATCAQHAQLTIKKKVTQVPIRWNSTYSMLDSVLAYRNAFYHLQHLDPQYKNMACFPSTVEWARLEKIVAILKPFYDITTLFSGGSYPTANLYFTNIRKIQQLIEKNMTNEDGLIKALASFMSEKFKKYWDCYSVVLSFAIILDPRFKLDHVAVVFKFLNPSTALEKVSDIKSKLYSLFSEYELIAPRTSISTSEDMMDVICSDDADLEFDQFEDQYKASSSKSELDMYLDEAAMPRGEKLQILRYWKSNSQKWPHLSLLARDILSIPITTVALESAFSIGGRVLDKYRSRTLPKNAEAKICTRDWLYGCTVYAKDDDDSEEEDEEDEAILDVQSWIARLSVEENAS